jgi:hypothetical protein
MGNNNALIMLVTAGGLLYFYNTSPAFKTKIDQFFANLKGQPAPGTPVVPAGATPATTTTLPATGEINIQASDLVSTHQEDCAAAYGGSCTGECKVGNDTEGCNTCVEACGNNSIGGTKLADLLDDNGTLVLKKGNDSAVKVAKAQKTADAKKKKEDRVAQVKQQQANTPQAPAGFRHATVTAAKPAPKPAAKPAPKPAAKKCSSTCAPFANSPGTHAYCCAHH